ncbi:hypothetical protein J4Q44_G00369790 [Coregonus suidteri]|uniref:C2H2-type domain-containing protein n=1 Tax=Coregonus suidteri TaxID=861788 RepID=A0AAN8KNK4_9TELE
MSKLQSFRAFLNERLTAAAVEIFGAVEQTVVDYQEENDRLRRLLRITPEINRCRIDSLQLSLAVSEEEVLPDQQHCEQEWSPSLGQENPELPQIKEEQEELRTTQEEEQLQGLEADIIEFKFTPSCVKSECDQEDPLQSLTLPQTQTVENRERDPKQVDLTPFVTVTHLKGLYIPCDPPGNQNNASSHSSAVSSDPVGLDSSPPLDPSPSLGEHCFKPSTMSRKTHRCRDCGEMFVLKTDLQRHVTLPMQRPNECRFCKKRYNSTCKLKAHVRLCRVEQTVVEYLEENDRLRRLLRITPEIQLCRIDSLQLSLAVSEEEVLPDQQHCEQEWSPSLGQENPELPQIKEEQEELRTTQEEEQLQGLEADIKFTPSCMKSECDQEDPLQSLTLPQTQTVENRERDPKQVDLTPFVTVTHLKGLYIPCDPPDNQNNASSHSSAVSSDPVGLDSSPPLDPSPSLNPNPSMEEHCSKPSTTSRKPHRCRDCGEMFTLKADLQRHVTLYKKRLCECRFCRKSCNSTCKLKAHVRLCHSGKPCTCPVCGKTFKLKGDLSKHMRIHTGVGEKPFSCGDYSLQLSLAVSEEEVLPDQQHCEQEWSPSLGQENPELPQIKEEQEELRTSQEEEQLQGLEADIKFTPSCVKSECDQEDPLQPLTLPQTQTVENRERDPKQVDLTPYVTVTHLKGLYIPCDPPGNQNNASSQSSAVIINPVVLDSSPPLDPKPSMEEHCSKPSTTSRKPHRCRDCGEMFTLKADLQRHVTLYKKRLCECRFCRKSCNSTCKLKAHVRLCHSGKPCTCPVCGKTFKLKGYLSKHMRIHTGVGEKPFSCESLQLSLVVSEEEVLPEQQEWSPSLGQENPELTQIKEEELRTTQEGWRLISSSLLPVWKVNVIRRTHYLGGRCSLLLSGLHGGPIYFTSVWRER